VKKVTDGEKDKVKQLALPPSTSTKPEKDGKATFLTSCLNQPNKTDEDLTEEALLKQYDELLQKGEIKKDKKKGKKPIYDNAADELIDELDQHEKEMNDMLKYLQET